MDAVDVSPISTGILPILTFEVSAMIIVVYVLIE